MKKALRPYIQYMRRYVNFLIYLSSNSNAYSSLKKEQKKIILTLAADYGNLGDIAITHAQYTFLKNNFTDYEIVALPISKTYQDLKSLRKHTTEKDIVTIIGGGNMGDLYQSIEEKRQFIIKRFSKNHIISFPQTIDFSNHRHLRRAQAAYNKHKKLILCAREEPSYHAMQELFTRPVYLLPDIVLYLDVAMKQKPSSSNKITLCIRQDAESIIDKQFLLNLQDYLKQAGKTIAFQDTHIGDVTLNLRSGEQALKGIWSSFQSSQLVITDRLHGMIFCAITQTPCIAFNNSNGKVSTVYKRWLGNVPYIRVIDQPNVKKIEKEIVSLNKLGNDEANSLESLRKNAFKELLTYIKGLDQ